MGKSITPLYIDEELKKKAKSLGINLSKLMNQALEKEIGIINGISVDFLLGELSRVEAEKKAFIEKKDNELLILKQRLDDLENQEEKLHDIFSDPYTKDKIGIVREHPHAFDVNLKILKKHFNFPIPRKQFDEWVNGGKEVV